MLDTIRICAAASAQKEYPFSLPLIKNLTTIDFPTSVTFLVGENGTGKSTLLEAIAVKAGFGKEGGSKNIAFQTAQQKVYDEMQSLADALIFSWKKKPKDGYFFRAETFFNVINHLDAIAREGGDGVEQTYASYGGKPLHERSHGEGFMDFFKNRVGRGGFFIFDEPEAALSPQRQLSLLVIIHEICKKSQAQFIIATHSPLLLAYPGATIYSCDSGTLEKIAYTDTQHYQVTKSFLDNPERYLQYLLDPR